MKKKPRAVTTQAAAITVERAAFLGAMRDAIALIRDSGHDYARLSVEDGFLTLRAVSRALETWVERQLVTTKGSESWSPIYVALTRELYTTIAKNMPGAALVLVCGNMTMTLTAGDRSLVIATHTDPGQPAVPEIAQPDATFVLDAALLRNALLRGGFMHGLIEPRYYIEGALLRFEPQRGLLDVCSTDGALLALATMPIEQANAAQLDVLIESDAVRALVETIDEPGPVSVTANADWIEFRAPGYRVATKRQRGGFPAFKEITGQTGPLRVEFDSGEMLSALAFVGAGKGLPAQLDVTSGVCALSSESEVYGDRKASLMVAYDGPKIRAVYNSNLLIQLIESMHPCRVVWTTQGNERHESGAVGVRAFAQFRPDGRDDHVCVLMPMRL